MRIYFILAMGGTTAKTSTQTAPMHDAPEESTHFFLPLSTNQIAPFVLYRPPILLIGGDRFEV